MAREASKQCMWHCMEPPGLFSKVHVALCGDPGSFSKETYGIALLFF